MKTMKKLAAVLLAAAMALTLLTACGGGGGGGGSTSGGDSMETVFNFTGEELTAELNKELSSNAVYDKYLGDILRKRHLRRIIRLDTYIINRATSGQQTRYAYKKNASHLHLFKRGRFTPPHYVKSLTALK